MPVEKPFTYQYILDRWADGLKVLGAGNSAGLLASGASFQFFATKPEVVGSIHRAAFLFLIGVFFFAMALLVLTVLPLAIERFVFASHNSYQSFHELLAALIKHKQHGKAYLLLVAVFSSMDDIQKTGITKQVFQVKVVCFIVVEFCTDEAFYKWAQVSFRTHLVSELAGYREWLLPLSASTLSRTFTSGNLRSIR